MGKWDGEGGRQVRSAPEIRRQALPGFRKERFAAFTMGGAVQSAADLHELDADVEQFRRESGTVSGEYHNRIHIVSGQLIWHF